MKYKKWLSIVISAIFIMSFICTPINYVIDKLYGGISVRKTVPYNEAELYPFENKTTAVEDGNTTIINLYNDLSQAFITNSEKLYSRYCPFRYSIIEQYGRVNKMIGDKIICDENDTVLRIAGDYLMDITEKNDIDTSVERITEFANEVKSQGMDFVYMMFPEKYIDESEIVPNIFENTMLDDKDELVERMRDSGIDVLDMREYMPSGYQAEMELFFKTDHHWKPSTALEAARLFAEKINCDYAGTFDLKLFDSQQYDVRHYPELMLGSLGKKVSKGYVKLEDFDLPVPKFQNNLHVYIPRYGIDTDGNFETLIMSEELEYGHEYTNNPYGALAYGDQPLIQIANKTAHCKKKILILKDSFANAMVPYLALDCEQIDVIDLRCFDGSLKTYLKKNSYDMVAVMMRSSGKPYDNTDKSARLWDFK